MSFVSFYKCDHCGKKLDKMQDYIDMEIESIGYGYDLCYDCYLKLKRTIRDFLKREEAECQN